jgi:hypothetical protein
MVSSRPQKGTGSFYFVFFRCSNDFKTQKVYFSWLMREDSEKHSPEEMRRERPGCPLTQRYHQRPPHRPDAADDGCCDRWDAAAVAAAAADDDSWCSVARAACTRNAAETVDFAASTRWRPIAVEAVEEDGEVYSCCCWLLRWWLCGWDFVAAAAAVAGDGGDSSCNITNVQNF